jgi:putative spermidine/putrescine transport system permease protein
MSRRRHIESPPVRLFLRVGTALVLAFLYVPLAVIILYAFNSSRAQGWPIEDFSTKWFGVAWDNGQVREAFRNSIEVAAAATTLALVLGSLAAFAVHRFRFFGRETVSFLLVLPIALPGIVTGMALNSAINLGGEAFGLSFSLFTIIVGHATFCIVVVYNNVVARLRRTPTSLVEASMDLGANGLQTFRYVTLPSILTALIAGALLAFALSFDEIIVTNFTSGTEATLPKWIFNNLRLPNQRPQVNVVAFAVVVASFIPVYIAQKLTEDEQTRRPGGRMLGRFVRRRKPSSVPSPTVPPP